MFKKIFCNGLWRSLRTLSCKSDMTSYISLTISRKMKFAGYFSYLLIAETLLLVAGQSLYDYGLNADMREAVRTTGMINLNFETSKRPPLRSNP